MTPSVSSSPAQAFAAMPFADWAACLLDPSHPTPPGLVAWNGSDPQVRLDVHRNTVTTALVDALADSVPVVQALVGEAFFRTMALHFTRQQPPRSPCLWRHALGLPDFIGGYAAASGLPYLADVARLEVAQLISGHAADAPRLTPEDLAQAGLQPAQLLGLRLHMHPGVQIVRSAHPVVSLWAAHQVPDDEAVDLSAIDMTEAQSALVICADDDVVVIGIPEATARWLQALAEGLALGDAVQQASVVADDAPPFDLATSWAMTLARGCFTHWTLETP